MGLLSITDVTNIRSAIKSVTDTFFTMEAVIEITGASLDFFNEDREDADKAIVTVKCLAVFDTSGGDALAAILRNGTYDFDKGYALFNVEDMQAAGLLDLTGTALIEATRDSLTIGNERFKITGINPVGYLVDASTLIKIHLERQVKSK